ncbi:integral membrane efflux protein [Streptomyces mobaraensis NBRC 13819 = DSM 40847]|uniref:Integral membrane efflux protein n=1 Tax=Streptomyces mobaraensis (strain ATCC 29032 / DSM 40847 / JCM 4168 / NBRC 13819 / NCIMB 11159 / IPCR 16-22) TaxID=1223523 RepID=M3C4S0_STRM1|nr:MFS transporter [Streptomyces mobaraensis]EME98926.1 integral membrane efflux protein [Streptomyces mobaraensis NBRC 13819 = DSM 40847]
MTTTPTLSPPGAGPHPDPRRWWALAAIVACMLVLGFDGTILNVALPTMATELDADAGTLQWIADSYLVVFAALMLPAGLLGDRFGRRRTLVAGLAVFLAGSLVGTFAQDAGTAIAARAVMGVGAAFVMPLAMSVLPALFTPDERGKAIGAVSGASALGLPLGPIIGGLLLDHFWWGSVFLVNVPLVGVAVVACRFLLPELKDPAAPAVDALATLLTVGGLGALVYGVTEGPDRGWTSPAVLGTLTAAVVLLTLLTLRSRRQTRPMLDLPLLRHRGFLWNTIAAALAMFVFTGLLFFLPSYLQTVRGNDAFGTGLRMIPMPVGMLIASRLAPPLTRRAGVRVVIPAGLVLLGLGALLGSRTSVGDGYAFTATWLVLAGTGVGIALIPAMDSALGALPRDRVGVGSGLLMTLRQVAGATGVAILGSMLTAAYRAHLETPRVPAAAAEAAEESVMGAHRVAAGLGDAALTRSADAAYLHGMDLALLACCGIAFAAALLVAAFLPGTRARVVTPSTAVAAETSHARQ